MPNALAVYIRHCAKYQSTEDAIICSTERKKERKDNTIPLINVTHADAIMISSFLSFIAKNYFKCRWGNAHV